MHAARSIENGNAKVSFNWKGRREKNGAVLWMVGTNLAKDRLAARMEVTQPGPGYVHLSSENTDEWFRQLAAEDRVTIRGQYGTTTRWVPNRKRNEVIDMTAYAIWLEERLDLWAPRMRKFWRELEDKVQPAVGDLFDFANASMDQPQKAKPPADSPLIPARKPAPARRGGFAKTW